MGPEVLLLVSLLGASTGFSAEPSPSLCFERGSNIWVANLDGTAARQMTRGENPTLSPDGGRIAFNTDTAGSKSLERRIAVVEVATKKLTTFKDEIPSDNCQRPVWSPDGAHILFNVWTDNAWHLALVNANGSGFRYVKKAAAPNKSLWSQCWAPDSRAIYAQDLDRLYRIALDGTELRSWSLPALIPRGSLSSSSNMSVSPDGSRLLVDLDMDDETLDVRGWDGPPSSVWTIDLASGKADRVTAAGVLGWAGCWLDGEQILFSGRSAKGKDTSIYQMTLKTGDKRVVVRKGNNPTAARAAAR